MRATISNPPGDANCFAASASAIFARPLRQNNATGKSPKVCPALRAKISPLPRRANQKFNSRHPVPSEGRWLSSRTRGRERWTRRLRLTSVALAYGEIVWVRRPGAGVKLAEAKASNDDGGKEAGHQDDHV